MVQRPTGTVTFLFTDVEASTRLWEQHPTQMDVALAQHDVVVRSAIEHNGGYVFSTAGDSFSAAFTSARNAVAAAVHAQRMLGEVDWSGLPPIRVRMGVHTGEAHERDGDYFGPALNRAARIMSVGHGGQVLVSAVTAGLLDGEHLVDLGDHRLKDLSASERLFQVGDGSFPSVRSLESVRNNLPVQRTSLVGREDDVADVCALVAEHRLVTLTGIGGAGKTRLAIAAAAELVDRFPDGVFVADLAPVADDGLVFHVVAEAADLIAKGAGGSTLGHVARVLARRRVLLVLDNCEQVIDGAAEFVDIFLDSGAEGRVLITSRESLEVEGERTLRVRSLRENEAVTLLAERAATVRSGFAVTRDNRSTLASICEQLDGIPLAIELAAAQLAHLSAQELGERLDDRFELLSGGRRRRRQRQQTLSAMMDWSWELLDDDERQVLSALAVFSGGWSLPAAEHLCAGLTGRPVVELLRDLHAKSLLVVDDTSLGSRFRLLETVRLYGERKLVETARAAPTRDAHANYWVQMADREGFVGHVNNVAVVEALLRDLDNTRAAVDWLVTQDRTEDAAQVVSMLDLVFKHRNQSADWFTTRLLDRDLTDRSRAQVLVAAAFSSWISGNFPRAAEQGNEAEALAVRANDPAIAAVACIFQSFPWQVVDPEKALEITGRGERHAMAARAACLERDARAYTSLVWAFGMNEPERAERACRRDLPDTLDLGNDRWDVGGVLGSALEVQGKWSEAIEVMREQHRFHQAAGLGITWTDQIELAALEAELGDDVTTDTSAVSYRVAFESANAEGIIGPRPEFLLQPLGRAIRTQNWPLAAALVNGIRELSHQGVAFVSSNAMAIYLNYRRQVADRAPHDRSQPPVEYEHILRTELERAGGGQD